MNTSTRLLTSTAGGVSVVPSAQAKLLSGSSSLSGSAYDKLLKNKYLLVAAGTVVSTVFVFGVYRWWLSGRKRSSQETEVPPLRDGQSAEQRAKEHIHKELIRLKDPKLEEDEDGFGYMQKKDFFDLLAVIQLKTKLKLQRDVGRNQKERVRLLEAAMSQANQDEAFHYYTMYINKTMEIMQRECDQYEDQFQKVLALTNVSNEIWEASRELYIQGGQEPLQTEGETPDGRYDPNSIESIERRIYAFLPQPNLPKSLTPEMTKQIMLDINHRGQQIYRKYMKDFVLENCNPEYEPLLLESLTFDLTLVEYNYNENVLRYATHKYGLQKDPEIREQLEEYLSS